MKYSIYTLLLVGLLTGCTKAKYGQRGQNAQPCTITDTVDGALITCAGITIGINDGQRGDDGIDGQNGIDGQDGAIGAEGQAGPPGEPGSIKCYEYKKHKDEEEDEAEEEHEHKHKTWTEIKCPS